ncbi:MAG TPA: helix-turn-helix domain-containing protein [Burkholderiales bacterium]|nr:helix-turn-helix domain-containing protein [Burkholderiales bacterium]
MNSRDEIINAACRVFAQLGFRGCTTRRIADAAGVNEVTIFRQFGSKEALLREAMKTTHSAGLAPLPDVPSDPERELTLWSESFIKHLRLRSSMIRKTMSEMEERPDMSVHASYVPKQASADLCHYLVALKRQGRTAERFDAKTASAMLMGAIFADAMGRGMMPEVYPQPQEKAAQMYTRLLLKAIGVENGTRRTTNKQTKRAKQLSA